MATVASGQHAPMSRTTWLVLAAVAALIAASAWYLQAPPRGPEAYRERAAATAEALRSHVQTALLWAATERRGDATRRAATVGFEEAETDAVASAATFAGYDPPPGTRELRAAVTRVADETVAALADLRIAAARGEWERIAKVTAPLGDLAERLDRLERLAAP